MNKKYEYRDVVEGEGWGDGDVQGYMVPLSLRGRSVGSVDYRS